LASTLPSSKQSSPSHLASPDSLLPPSSTFKDLYGYTGHKHITQNNLSDSQLISNLHSICNLNFPLACNVT
jgi:hypothetical protein